MTTTAQFIASYATAGRTITAETAALYIAQRENEIAAYTDAMSGGTYDYTATRPYADQILCGCGDAWCTWAIEGHRGNGKPERITLCDTCASRSDAAAEKHRERPIAWVQLFTVEQIATRARLAAEGIGN